MKKGNSTIKTTPFRGGCNTAIETALVPFGAYSMVQNFRNLHPGMVKRTGCAKLHSTADSTNKVMSIYQSVKPASGTRKFFGQFSDGDVLEATSNPPTVTTGVFGSEVYSGNASPRPGAWSTNGDLTIFSSGVDAHQVYAGTGNFSPGVYWYSGSADADISNAWITGGKDFTTNLSDGDSSTYADISSFTTCGGVVADLITNGAFAADTDWTKVGSAAIADGVLTIAGATGNVQQSVTPVAGVHYKVSYSLSAITGTLYICLRDASTSKRFFTAKQTANGDYTHYWTADSSAAFNFQITDFSSVGAGETVSIDNVKCEQLKNDYLFVASYAPISSLTFTMSSANGDAAVAAVKFWNGSAWTAVSGFSDGTIASAGKSFGQTGTMSWTQPTTAIPCTLFDKHLYWTMVYLSSGTVDAETRISALTYGQTSFTEVKNLWEGTTASLLTARFVDSSAGTTSTYAGSAITLTDLTSSDYLYIACTDETDKFNITIATAATYCVTLAVEYWNGSAWTAVSGLYDDTQGFVRSGSMTFDRASSTQTELFNVGYNAYWYRISISSTSYYTSSIGSPVFALTIDPYFDSDDLGTGYCNTTWNGRTIYASNADHYLIASGVDDPQEINGDDSGILAPGDGRTNRVVYMGNLNNYLLAIQEEVGKEGGCITRFTPDSDIDNIATSAHVVSTKLGTFSAHSADIIDGVEFAEFNSDTPVMSLCFAISRQGVYVTDGSNCYIISDAISNYFDPNESECIRRGYESGHWLHYDSSKGVVLIGLVSGSSATVPNVFPVYDLKDKTWSFDSRYQELACMTEVEAASGNVQVLQVGGGVDDGTIYLLNSGTNDVDQAIDSYVTVEYDGQGEILHADEVLLRCKTQSAGDITLTPYLNAIAGTAKTLSMTAATANETIRRHREHCDLTGQHISLKVQHATASQSCHLLDIGLETVEYSER